MPSKWLPFLFPRVGVREWVQRRQVWLFFCLIECNGARQEGASLPLPTAPGQRSSVISTAASVPSLSGELAGVSLPWAWLQAGIALSFSWLCGAHIYLYLYLYIYIYINISLCTGVRVAFMEGGRLGAARFHHCWSCPAQCYHSLNPQNWEGPVKRINKYEVWCSASLGITNRFP